MTNQLPEKHKGRKAAIYRGAECKNCGHPLDLSDVYCSYCGQLNTTKSLSLKDFFGEFMSSIITYDSRFRYTLKDLLFRPGVITRKYVDGKRLRYANPFRFFLSVSIIYFLIQGLITTVTGTNNMFNSDKTQKGPNFELGPTGNNVKLWTTNNDSISLDSLLKQKNPKLDSILKSEGITPQSIFGQDEIPTQNEIDSIVQHYSRFGRNKDTIQTYEYISEEHLDTLSWGNKLVQRFVLYYDFYNTTGIKDPSIALDSLKHKKNGYNRWAYQKNKAFETIKENPTEFFNYLVEKTPFFVFFFTPFYALFFWLLYSKKKYTYMEHMIFIFHIFSFVFLGMLIAVIPDTLIGSDIFGGILFGLIGPFYFYKALRNFYKQNRLITIIKFILLNWVFWVSATISAIIFFAITAAMY
ncbi:MAG: DUF3667 domain-containing protein [Flavobacteriaceae bacterium]|nr:DUF3667 domain-containing protein [Flavobacteriaceae bacterium]